MIVLFCRDCFISECDPDSMKVVQEFAKTDSNQQALQDASLKATIALQDRIEYWPKPVGLGITLWKDLYQATITLLLYGFVFLLTFSLFRLPSR